MDINIKHSILEFLPNTVETIRKIYNLDGDRMQQSLDILVDWIKKQEHFTNKDFDLRYLDYTLISSKGSVEKAKRILDRICTLKTLLPKYFIGGELRGISDKVHDVTQAVILPKMTKDYQRICINKFYSKNMTSGIFLDYYCYGIAVFNLLLSLLSDVKPLLLRSTIESGFTCEYLKLHDYANGYIIIDDLSEVNLVEMLTKINLIEFQEFLTIVMEGYGARMTGIHVITQSKTLDVIMKTIKPFLSPKLNERIFVHQDVTDLCLVIDKEVLPVEYGGEERSIAEIQAEWRKVVHSEEMEKILNIMKESKTDESKRQIDKYNEQCIGLPGSFRTLTMD